MTGRRSSSHSGVIFRATRWSYSDGDCTHWARNPTSSLATSDGIVDGVEKDITSAQCLTPTGERNIQSLHRAMEPTLA